jgi:transcriptional regulator with XRE-family HTH domain
MQSRLAAAIQAVFRKHHLRAADVCRAQGMSNSLFSRLFSGRQQFISPSDLAKITRAVPDPQDRAELVRARVQDLVAELADLPGADLLIVRTSIRKT